MLTKYKIILCTIALLFPFLAFSQNYDQQLSSNSNVNDSEGEAQIAIHPNDSSKMIVGYMEVTPGTLNFKIQHSDDGGDTWIPSSFDPKSIITTDYPTYTPIGGGDIVFAYGINGDVYCSWIYLLADMNLPSPLDSCIWTSYWAKSTDNGQSFTYSNNPDRFFARGKLSVNGPITTYDYEDGIADRQWMAVDHSGGPHHGNLYVGYINYPFNTQNTGLKLKRKTSLQSGFGPENLVYPGNGQLTNLLVDQNGVIHYTFADILQDKIYHVSSSDGGQSFTNPHLIFDAIKVFPRTNFKINNRENAAPSLAIDNQNHLHLVWSDYPPNSNLPKSYYSRSVDNGVTWSTALDLETLFSDAVYIPVVSAYGNKVTISGNIVNSQKISNYKTVTSLNNGVNFNPPKSITTGTINFDSTGPGAFVGDYSSSARLECNIFSMWTHCNNNGCKQYISRYNDCLPTQVTELTPLNSSFYLNQIYPNPVQDILNLNIQSNKTDQLRIEIYDLSGKLLYESSTSIIDGTNEVNINLAHISSGLFQLKLTNQDHIFITRNILKN